MKLIGRLLISLKIPTKDTEGRPRFTLKPATNPLHCGWKMKMISQKSTSTTSANSTKSHQKPAFSNNDKQVSVFEKKEDQKSYG